MGRLNYHALTVRKRPHFQPLDATLFTTFRLVDSIPRSTVRQYKAKRDWLKNQLIRVEEVYASEPASECAHWIDQLETLKREWFIKCEDILHRMLLGPTWMSEDLVAQKVAENLYRLDGDAYRLDAFSIMSNHVHTVFKPLVNSAVIEQMMRAGDDAISQIPALSKIMHALKGRSARECNLILGRSGSFWEHESFDHVIRAGKFDKTVRYVLNNPVKIGLVGRWQDYRWNYCRPDLIERFTGV